RLSAPDYSGLRHDRAVWNQQAIRVRPLLRATVDDLKASADGEKATSLQGNPGPAHRPITTSGGDGDLACGRRPVPRHVQVRNGDRHVPMLRRQPTSMIFVSDPVAKR